jgi:hypothetical protein
MMSSRKVVEFPTGKSCTRECYYKSNCSFKAGRAWVTMRGSDPMTREQKLGPTGVSGASTSRLATARSETADSIGWRSKAFGLASIVRGIVDAAAFSVDGSLRVSAKGAGEQEEQVLTDSCVPQADSWIKSLRFPLDWFASEGPTN